MAVVDAHVVPKPSDVFSGFTCETASQAIALFRVRCCALVQQSFLSSQASQLGSSSAT